MCGFSYTKWEKTESYGYILWSSQVFFCLTRKQLVDHFIYKNVIKYLIILSSMFGNYPVSKAHLFCKVFLPSLVVFDFSY